MLDQDLFAEARRLDRADLANQQHDVVRRRLRQSQLGMLTADYAILVIEPECLRDEKPRRQRISAHLAAECRIQQLPAHNVPVPLSSHARMPMRELRPIPQEDRKSTRLNSSH